MNPTAATLNGKDFLAPRRCMLEPIEEIFHASQLLSAATEAHLAGNRPEAEKLLSAANMSAVRAWTESLWGSRTANPDQWRYHRIRSILGAPPHLPKPQRVRERMPTSVERSVLIERYGRNCALCGIPVISEDVRKAFNRLYPEAAPWGRTNPTQHAAFQCMWLQFDHVLPHSRGGDNSIDNILITCVPCNYGRWNRTLEEVGLIDPRTLALRRTNWGGLEGILA